MIDRIFSSVERFLKHLGRPLTTYKELTLLFVKIHRKKEKNKNVQKT